MKRLIAVSLLILASVTLVLGADPGWPRQLKRPGGTLVYYQPQVDDWKNFTDITMRIAFSLTPAGGQEVVGVLELGAHTDVDNDNKEVLLSGLNIARTHFPSLDPVTAAKMDQLVRTFLPPQVSISLHRLVSCVKKPGSVTGVTVKNDPPAIFTSNGPAILLAVDGEPTLADVPKTQMAFVVNTNWPLFLDKARSSYYLLIGQQWMTASRLDGPWAPTTTLPQDMSLVAADPQWAALKKVIPPPAGSAGAPRVFYSQGPAEVLLFDGAPLYSQPIPGTRLVYSTNTSSYLFLHTVTNNYYYLTGGRWFRAITLQGPWTYASADLPADFSQIPADNPAAVVLASVPGTEEAKDAVLLAQVPTRMTVDPVKAAHNVKVSYGGDPQFEPITGTSLSYAANTQDKVIRVGNVYYLCLQGVWFLSTTPQGTWSVADSVPQEIYTIPLSSPVYNVTYVTQETVDDGTIQSSYSAGYMGAFVAGLAAGAIIASGSGYYYPPYIYHPAYGYPAYYPHPCSYGAYGAYGTAAHYNSATGAYGVSQTVSGPYGTATRGAAYNPYTGTSARGATVSTPYGSRSAAQAYNPYTGSYAATRQGSSPTAQWGSSVVSKGGQTAYTQHYSTSQGTVGSVQTSSGGKAVGANTAYGNTTAAKTSSGDMYATHDGNVYKNTGSGWKSYDNGSWNSVNKPASAPAQPKAQTYQQPPQERTPTYDNSSLPGGGGSANQEAAQERAQGAQEQRGDSAGTANRGGADSASQMQGMQQEAQNRQRGEQQTQRFQQGGGGGGGQSRGGGGRRR